MTDRKTLIAAALVFAAIALAGWGRTVPTFWSADNGVKWIQAKTISETGVRDAVLDYPESDLDPEGIFQPLGWKFGKVQEDGRIRFSYPPYFATLLAPFAKRDAFQGALVGVALFGALCFLLVERIARGLEVRRSILFALSFVLLSPFCVYLVEVNEQPMTFCLGLLAWLLLFGGKERTVSPSVCLIAGLTVGLAGVFRNEFFPWGAALVFVLLVERRWKEGGLVVLGVAAMFVGGAALTSALSPSTPMLRGVDVHDAITQSSFGLFYFEYRWALLNHWLFSWGHYDEAFERSLFHPGPWICLAAVGLAGAIARWGGRARGEPAFALGAGLLGVAYFFLWWRILGVGYPHVGGLAIAFPLVSLWLLFPLRTSLFASPFTRRALVAVVAYSAVVLILVGLSRGGRQWGPRYLMVTWPFLLAIPWKMIEETFSTPRHRWRRAVRLPLLLVSALAGASAFLTVRSQQESFPLETIATWSERDPSRVFLSESDFVPPATVAAGHEHWMSFRYGSSDETRGALIQRLLDSRGEFVWVGRKSPEKWMPPTAAVVEEAVEKGYLFARISTGAPRSATEGADLGKSP